MKRRYANKVDAFYYQDRIETDYFKGYICYLKMKNVKKPLIVFDSLREVCIKDNNYEWIELYPDNGKYAITIMYDDKDNLIEWYFDIAKSIGIENNIPYEDDLYLDLVITKEGKHIVLDEDELLQALKDGDITNDDVNDAYKTLEYLKNKYVNDFEKLKSFTTYAKEYLKKGMKKYGYKI